MRNVLAVVAFTRRAPSALTVVAAVAADSTTIVKVSLTALPCSFRRPLAVPLGKGVTSSVTALTATLAWVATAVRSSRRAVGVKSDTLPVTTTAIETAATMGGGGSEGEGGGGEGGGGSGGEGGSGEGGGGDGDGGGGEGEGGGKGGGKGEGEGGGGEGGGGSEGEGGGG